MRARAALAFAFCAAAVGAAGCSGPRAGSGPPAELADYPGRLQPASALGAQVLWRQRVIAQWPDGERGFDAAVQVAGDSLLVLGLSPVGAPGFEFHLDGEELTVVNRTGDDLPIPPRYVLLDVQRVFFPWLDETSTAREGTVFGERFDEVVRESREHGRLVRRSFARLDGHPPGEIVVTYEYDRDDWLAPTRAVLDNGWFGYRLVVTTVEETRLELSAEEPPR